MGHIIWPVGESIVLLPASPLAWENVARVKFDAVDGISLMWGLPLP